MSMFKGGHLLSGITNITEAQAKPLTSLDFRRSIIDDLVREQLQSSIRPTIGRPRLRPTPVRLNNKLHLFNQRASNRNCVVCSGERRHTTSYYCTTCPEEPALHPTTCFERHHTLEYYRIWKTVTLSNIFHVVDNMSMSNITA